MPTRPPANIIPRRARRKDAEDIADELIAKILLQRERIALFITPNGEWRMCGVRDIRFQDWCEQWPCSLLGIYDIEVERDHVADEIQGRVKAILGEG